MMRWSASWSSFVEDVENGEAAEPDKRATDGPALASVSPVTALRRPLRNERCDDRSILAIGRGGHEIERDENAAW